MADFMTIAVTAAVAFGAGIVPGYLLGRRAATSPWRGGGGAPGTLAAEVAAVRAGFEAMEASRREIERERARFEEERERRLIDHLTHTRDLLGTQEERHRSSDTEREERMQEWMEETRRYYTAQKESYEQFLVGQGKTREEIETKRDAQLADMNRMIRHFTRAVAGTSTRGAMGEGRLREALAESIRAGVVVTPLRTGPGEVEFAWNLEDGRYIPIDSKFPDLMDVLEEYERTDDPGRQKQLKREIVTRVKREIGRVQKYQNLPNTTAQAILVVPEGVIDAAPELVAAGRTERVFICSYRDIFPVAHTLQEDYIRTKQAGDAGKYRQVALDLLGILARIQKRTETITRALVTIENATTDIRTETLKGRRIGGGDAEEQAEEPEEETATGPTE
ncbi:MAG TPA: DNA recombination protein RmuC [Methanoculleus sp.]|nr:DNA recombination protein RmuC [Methanoculleus sp.]